MAARKRVTRHVREQVAGWMRGWSRDARLKAGREADAAGGIERRVARIERILAVQADPGVKEPAGGSLVPERPRKSAGVGAGMGAVLDGRDKAVALMRKKMAEDLAALKAGDDLAEVLVRHLNVDKVEAALRERAEEVCGYYLPNGERFGGLLDLIRGARGLETDLDALFEARRFLASESVAGVEAMLAGRVEEVCRHYLPDGKRDGGFWRVDESGGWRCLYVRVDGSGSPGAWTDVVTGANGGMVDLVRRVRGLPSVEAAVKDVWGFLVIGRRWGAAHGDGEEANRRFDAAAVCAVLVARAEVVCRHYLPGGRRRGNYWMVGSIEGEPGDSFRVHLARPWRGRWRDGEFGRRGNLVDLIKGVRGLPSDEAALIEAGRFLARDLAGEPHPPLVPAEKKIPLVADDGLDDIPF